MKNFMMEPPRTLCVFVPLYLCTFALKKVYSRRDYDKSRLEKSRCNF